MPALKTVSSDDDLEYKLNCCSECSANFEGEAQRLCERDHKPTGTMASTEQKLPLWLQQCKNSDNISRETDAAAQVYILKLLILLPQIYFTKIENIISNDVLCQYIRWN
jgi:hypothetical protein